LLCALAIAGGCASKEAQRTEAIDLVADAEERPEADPSSSPPPPNAALPDIHAAAPLAESERQPAPASRTKSKRMDMRVGGPAAGSQPMDGSFDTEAYEHIAENAFVAVADDPLSTFSIDVDTASYSNMRRFLAQGQLPPADAVRIEELVNYFSYGYREPTGTSPFSVTTEVTDCPWNRASKLVHIGLQGKSIDQAKTPPRNLVFLLDVSGSMETPDKLPLLRNAMKLLVENLRSHDRVSIVVYAGASGMVLRPTSGRDQAVIMQALDRLQAGGSTNGGAGIELAYQLAQKAFIQNGINRVVLATDGDFNVGVTNEGDLTRLIEAKRKGGVYLSVLGFGRGNLKDATMEQLADKGNGNYAYIDSITEARKVLVEEAGSTLVTIAKDVKLQVEFNPTEVASYRLIGYENRKLAHQDFNDDKKDAGEIGAGHSVTALYEVVPGVRRTKAGVDPLKYQGDRSPTAAASTGELLTFKIRYKDPQSSSSKLLQFSVNDTDLQFERASADHRFSAAVAEFGMLLRNSEHKAQASFDQVVSLAKAAAGRETHRVEFVALVERARTIAAAASSR
jgi:Ca-activated chloride channel family protein